LTSFRSALLMVAALTATIIVPAKAGLAAEPLASVATATLPSIALPDMLDPKGEPILTAPQAPDSEAPDSDILPDATADAAPAVKPSGDLAAMVAELRSPDASNHEIECLATGIYFESKGEPLAGQLAVADVIINRAQSGRFASTLCGVVRQRSQFSFVHGGYIPAAPQGSAQWRTAVAIARIARENLAADAAPQALFFHARYVHPGWRLTRVASVGNHVFYR
jgi:N-acetylmuramoyl-L-alanine amidase